MRPDLVADLARGKGAPALRDVVAPAQEAPCARLRHVLRVQVRILHPAQHPPVSISHNPSPYRRLCHNNKSGLMGSAERKGRVRFGLTQLGRNLAALGASESQRRSKV
jgi:hypothetical protein